MASMEMRCLDCDALEFDNFIRTCCPHCGSEKICVNSDEPQGGDHDSEDFETDIESEDA